jgi:AraC family transcriptional regulator
MSSHSHEFAALIFNRKGIIQVDCQGRRRITHPSTLTFVPAHEPHANYVHEEGHTLEIILHPPWVERLRQSTKFVEISVDVCGGPAIWLAMRLHQELQHSDDLTPLAVEGLTMELLAQVLRDTGVNDAKTRVPHWLGQVKDYLHAHFIDSPSLETIAAAVGVHPAHLTRAFRQHYHCTLGDYARRLRVDYACHLLCTSEMPLSQIALESGFADQGHFSRTFKAVTTTTPAQYRNLSGRAVLK